MKVKPRHMKKYKPRRRRSDKELQKKQLQDFEKLLEMDLNAFLTLSEEGMKKQTVRARSKMHSDLVKYRRELDAIGRDLGSGFPQLIQDYVKSMDEILAHSPDRLDPKLLHVHRQSAEKLKKNALKVS
jgi:hypothetical protein